MSSTQHINTAPVHTPVNSTSGMLLSPGLFSLIFGLVIIIVIILWYVSCHPWTDLLPSDLNGNSTPKSMVRNQYVRQRQLSYVASIEESFLLNMYRSQPNELLFWMAVEVVVWSAYKCHATLNSRKEITDFPLLIQLVDLQNLTCTVYYYYSFSY